ncbi:MAG: hypothetical protein ACRCYR_05570 [Phycicoccus sp.]
MVDHDVRLGVEIDTGAGDAWPGIRAQVLACDILVLAPPTGLDQDNRDLDAPDENTQGTTSTLAAHTAHTARLLRDHPYPPPS